MPTTPLGLTYPSSAAHTRLWEHFQTLAEDVDDEFGDIYTGWLSYTPVWSAGTAPSLGNGTLVGRQKRIGETQHVFIRLIWGSTTTGGTGNWQFTLPVTPTIAFQILPALVQDDSTGNYYPAMGRMSTSSPEVTKVTAMSTTPALAGLQATFPMTWAISDVLTIQGAYIAT